DQVALDLHVVRADEGDADARQGDVVVLPSGAGLGVVLDVVALDPERPRRAWRVGENDDADAVAVERVVEDAPVLRVADQDAEQAVEALIPDELRARV